MNTYQILSPQEAKRVCEHISKLEWKQGKARTKALTGTVKQNEEILEDPLLDTLSKRIAFHRDIQLDHLPLKLHNPKFSRYTKGQHYKLHTDAPWMSTTRTDLSCTLWLNDDYQGGDLIIDGELVRRSPGECVIYDCGSPHEVTPVTQGERLCVITWIQSRIRDPIKRKLVSDMRALMSKFEDNQELFVEASRIHSALLRRWVE